MKKLKKIVAYTLAIAIFAGASPLEVFANKQSNVTDLTITDNSTNLDKKYHITLNWKKPVLSSEANNDTGIIQTEVLAKHEPSFYEIFMRNASKNQQYALHDSVLATDSSNNVLPNLSKIIDFDFLTPGSIFNFKVTPVHYHNYKDAAGDIFQKIAQYTSAPITKEVLYMSDIEVSAIGSGKELTVTWDNPTMNGDIFWGYRISYTPTGSTSGGGSATSHRDVPLNDKNIIRGKDGKLTYTFWGDKIYPGTVYTVKVEPMINPTTLLRPSTTININNNVYDINYSQRNYEAKDVSVNLGLTVKDEGLDFVRITWDSLANTVLDIIDLTLYKSTDENFDKVEEISKLSGLNALNTNYEISDKPDVTTYYKIVVRYKTTSGEIKTLTSDVGIYNPLAVDFYPYKPVILSTTDNGVKPLTIDAIWQAFVRDPYNANEASAVDPDTGKYLDKNIKYRIWLTDDVANLSDPSFNGYYINEIDANSLEQVKYTGANSEKIPAYKLGFTEYYRKNADGTFTLVPIEDNKTYYFKIEAERVPTGEISNSEFANHFIPPLGSLEDRPITVSKPPLRIKTENGVEVITTDSITIQWDLKWYEAYNEATKTWDSVVGVKDDGTLVYGEDAKALSSSKVIYLNDLAYQNLSEADAIAKIKSDLAAKGATSASSLPIRGQKIRSDAGYEINVIPYDEMDKLGGYDAYHDMLIKPENDSKWTGITPAGDPNHPEYKITGLTPNTSYVVFFRPFYTDNNNKKTSFLPAFVMGTTLSERPPIDVTPTVPIIEGVTVTDTEITVRWNYSDSLTYELKLGEKLADYPNGGTAFAWDKIKDSLTFKTENNKKYAYYTFTNLFPETAYHAWVKSSAGTNSSAWSNPVQLTTLILQPPTPPKGLGLASKENLSVYNKENETTFENMTENYMVVEWSKISADKEKSDSAGNSNNDSTSATWLQSDTILNSYLAKFDNLIANKEYYVRAKTTLVAKRESTGTKKFYYYTVQVSLTEDFLDYVEITVPPLEENIKEDANTKIKVSEWSSVVKLFTKTTTGEYDGDKNPNMYPLPTDDFDILFDEATGTLTYRYRSDQKDSTGANDNLVDQRFVSKLLTDRIFDYKIEMTNYKDKKINQRIIEMPFTIVSAFDERKASFTVVADNLTVKVPYGALKNSEVKNLNDYGKGTTVKLVLKENPDGLPALNQGESFGGTPQKLFVSVTTKTKSVNLKQFEKNISLSLKLDNRYKTEDQNISAYYLTGNTAGFSVLKSDYDKVSGTIKTETKNLGTYAAIGKISAASNVTDPIDSELLASINSKIMITDLTNYNPNENVTAVQFNNIIAAVIKGEPSVEMNKSLSEEDFNSLGKSKVLVSGTYVTREAGISALVRVYEMKNKEVIKNYGTQTATDLSTVSENYKVSIQKALKAEIIYDTTINPKGNLTFREFFDMLNYSF